MYGETPDRGVLQGREAPQEEGEWGQNLPHKLTIEGEEPVEEPGRKRRTQEGNGRQEGSGRHEDDEGGGAAQAQILDEAPVRRHPGRCTSKR